MIYVAFGIKFSAFIVFLVCSGEQQEHILVSLLADSMYLNVGVVFPKAVKLLCSFYIAHVVHISEI